MKPSTILKMYFMSNFLAGVRMHIAFAMTYFGLVCLFETLRHGVFGLTSIEVTGTIYGALALGAVLLLRGDVVYTVYTPKHALYGDERLNWTWPRTALGVFLGPFIWILPVIYGVAMLQISVSPNFSATLVQTALVQMVLVGVAEGLFFREAVVKAFAGNRVQIYIISALSVFIFYVPGGVPQALIATGASIYFMTLRLIGTNVLGVAAVQGASIVVFSQVFDLGLAQSDIWSYAAFFLGAALALSLLILTLFSTSRRNFSYA